MQTNNLDDSFDLGNGIRVLFWEDVEMQSAEEEALLPMLQQHCLLLHSGNLLEIWNCDPMLFFFFFPWNDFPHTGSLSFLGLADMLTFP